jgi:hypothetical protein
MNFLSAIKLAASIIPILFDLIPAIEKAYPMPRQGAEKLNLLLELVRDAVDVAKDGVSWDDVAPLVQKWVASIVGFMNKTGVFNK